MKKAFIIFMSIITLAACSNADEETVRDMDRSTGTAENAGSFPVEIDSWKKIRFTCPAYVPYLLEATPEVSEELKDTLLSSSWEKTDADIPDGESVNAYIYNNGAPVQLTLYGTGLVDVQKNDSIERYRIDTDSQKIMWKSAMPDELSYDELIPCEVENISLNGVWFDISAEE